MNPPGYANLLTDTHAIGFPMGSDAETGALLRTLAAGKPGGRLLELGTGTGLATCWLLDGMDAEARLITIDQDEGSVAVARRHLGHDPRVTFEVGDGAAHLMALNAAGARFDLIFADTWPGKYDHLDQALALLAPGGLYVIDDMLPQPNWPQGHAPKVEALVARLEADPRLHTVRLNWSTGLMIAARAVAGR